jgi:hypothetical protein
MKLIIIVFLFSASLFAQEAKVIALSADDTATVKQAFDAVKAAQDHLSAVKQQIHEKYLTVESESAESTSLILQLSGDVTNTWSNMSWCEDPKDHTIKTVHEPEKPKIPPNPPTPPKMVKYRKELDGWGYGFEFSEGYKFIVPTPAKLPSNYWPNGNVTLTPGISIPAADLVVHQ